MRLEEGDNMMVAMVFFVFVPLLVLAIPFTVNASYDLKLQTALGVSDEINYTVDNNWSEKGTLDNLETDGDIVYPGANQQGNFTSFIQDVPRNRILDVFYDADMRDGNGYIEVRAWYDDPGTTGLSPNATREIDLESGTETTDVSFEEYNFFEIFLYLDETDGSNNERPHVDSLDVTFEVVEEDKAGIAPGTKIVLTYLLLGFGIVVFVLGIYKVMREVLMN